MTLIMTTAIIGMWWWNMVINCVVAVMADYYTWKAAQ